MTIKRPMFSRTEEYRWQNLIAVDRYREKMLCKSFYGIRGWTHNCIGVRPPMPYAARRKPVART